MNELWFKLTVAAICGLLLASITTKISYTCPPADGVVGCVSFEKALMHPSDLMENKQDSLAYFATTFIATGGIVFTTLSLVNTVQKNKKSKI